MLPNKLPYRDRGFSDNAYNQLDLIKFNLKLNWICSHEKFIKSGK